MNVNLRGEYMWRKKVCTNLFPRLPNVFMGTSFSRSGYNIFSAMKISCNYFSKHNILMWQENRMKCYQTVPIENRGRRENATKFYFSGMRILLNLVCWSSWQLTVLKLGGELRPSVPSSFDHCSESPQLYYYN